MLLSTRITVSLGALLLAACAPATQPPGAGGGASPAPQAAPATAPATGTPQRGGTLVASLSGAPENLHPYTQAKTGVLRCCGPVYETLVTFKYERPPDRRWDIDFEISPALAERWEQPDSTSYIFHVRRGVKWHDGKELTADDVAFSLDYLRDPKNTFTFRSNLADVATVEKMGDYTVKVTTKAPSPFFLELIAPVAEVDIIPKHVVERGDDLNKVAIGTGPFTLKEFDRTKAGVFLRNDSYWQPGRPFVDQVQIVHGLDDAARLAGFIGNKFDLHSLPDKLQLDALLANKRDGVYARNINALGVSIFMKQDGPPYSDLRVRRALHLALDRQELNQVTTLGEGTISPPGTPAIKAGWAIPQEELLKLPGYRQPKDQDVAEAKRLLAEAGYPQGFKSTLHYGTNIFAARAASEPIAAQYAKLGIAITILPQPQAEATRILRSGDYALALDSFADMNVARYQWDRLHSTGSLNATGVKDPQLDRILETQRTSPDSNERKRAVRAMQDLLLEKLYVLSTIDIPTYQLWQPWVKDYNYDQGGSALVGQHNLAWVWFDAAKLPADRR